MNKHLKSIFTIGLGATLILSNSQLASAKIVSIISEDVTTQQQYKYDSNNLELSYGEYQLDETSIDASLYKHFKGKTPIAFVDDVRGVVSVDDVNEAYGESQLNGQSFDTNKYTETQAKLAPSGTGDKAKNVSVNEKGEVIEQDEELPYSVEILNSTIPGQKLMYVIFPEGVNASEYTVTVKDIELKYDSSKNRFTGSVDEAIANKENVKVVKKQTDDEFIVEDIS